MIKDGVIAKLRMSGAENIIIANDLEISYIGEFKGYMFTIPRGVKGLTGVGISGLGTIEILKLNRELEKLEPTSISNLNNLKKVVCYRHQENLIQIIKHLYNQVDILIKE